MYLPWRGSHLTIWLLGSKHENVISATLLLSWEDFSAEMIGASRELKRISIQRRSTI